MTYEHVRRLALAMLVLAAFMLSTAGILRAHTEPPKTRFTAPAVGRVIEIVQRTDENGNTKYHAKYEYQVDGRTFTNVSERGTDGPTARVGDEIDCLYDPDSIIEVREAELVRDAGDDILDAWSDATGACGIILGLVGATLALLLKANGR